MVGPSCIVSTLFTAVTSSLKEVNGCSAIDTWYPSFTRSSYTGFHPDPFTHAPWTSTMFFAGSAIAGTVMVIKKRVLTVEARRKKLNLMTIPYVVYRLKAADQCVTATLFTTRVTP